MGLSDAGAWVCCGVDRPRDGDVGVRMNGHCWNN